MDISDSGLAGHPQKVAAVAAFVCAAGMNVSWSSCTPGRLSLWWLCGGEERKHRPPHLDKWPRIRRRKPGTIITNCVTAARDLNKKAQNGTQLVN